MMVALPTTEAFSIGSQVLEHLLRRFGLWKTLRARRVVKRFIRCKRKKNKNLVIRSVPPPQAWIDKAIYNPVRTRLWWTATDRALFWNSLQNDIFRILRHGTVHARSAVLFVIHISCLFPEVPGPVLEAVIRECIRHIATFPIADNTVSETTQNEGNNYDNNDQEFSPFEDGSHHITVVARNKGPTYDVLDITSSTRGSTLTTDTNEAIEVHNMVDGIVSKTLMPEDVIAVSSVLLCVAQAVRRKEWMPDEHISRSLCLAPEILADLDVRNAVFLTEAGLPLNAGLAILEAEGLVETTVEQRGVFRSKTVVQFVASKRDIGVEIEHGPASGVSNKILGGSTARMNYGRRIVSLDRTRNRRELNTKIRLA